MGIPLDNSNSNNNCNNCNNCNHCCNNCKKYDIKDILILLNTIRLNKEGVRKKIFTFNHNSNNEYSEISKKNKFYDDENSNSLFKATNFNRKINLTISNSKRSKNIKIKWWKLARDFFNLFVYIKTAIKYSKNRKYRNQKIKERKNLIGEEIVLLKNWIISIEQSFWNEFKVFKNLNLSFKHSYIKVKIKKEIKKITEIKKKYIKNKIYKKKKIKNNKKIINKNKQNKLKK